MTKRGSLKSSPWFAILVCCVLQGHVLDICKCDIVYKSNLSLYWILLSVSDPVEGKYLSSNQSGFPPCQRVVQSHASGLVDSKPKIFNSCVQGQKMDPQGTPLDFPSASHGSTQCITFLHMPSFLGLNKSNLPVWRLKYTEVQSQQMAFTQSPSLSNNPKIPTYYLIFAVWFRQSERWGEKADSDFRIVIMQSRCWTWYGLASLAILQKYYLEILLKYNVHISTKWL